MHSRTGAALAAVWLTLGCDWTTFEELAEQAPVVALTPPDRVGSGFGRSLATGRRGSNVNLLVGGNAGFNGAAVYGIGLDEEPSIDAAQSGFCDFEIEGCRLADRTAYLSESGDHNGCYAYGWGQSPGARAPGVAVRCTDNANLTLAVPAAARDARERLAQRQEAEPVLRLASDNAEPNALLAGLPDVKAAWFYAAGSTQSRALELPGETTVPESFGEQLTVVVLDEQGERRLFAVAAPKAGQVWLFDNVGGSAAAVGCLGAAEGFGQTLASGDVDGDGAQDLLIADGKTVTVFSGSALGSLSEASLVQCGLAALPPRAVLASFGCGSAEAADGCSKSDFGASLTVADLDGDGDGEVVVGAPGMRVFGLDDAGALLVYDAEGSEPHELSDVMFISGAQAGDRLGASVAALSQRGRDVLAAGAPGQGAAYVLYCSDLLPERARTGRCSL